MTKIYKRLFYLFFALYAFFLVYKTMIAHFPQIYAWDLFGSYSYLPQLFDKHQLVFHDLSYMEALNKQYDLSSTLYQFVPNENGAFMIKYTSGWAIMMAPFYLIAEAWASFGGYETNGFSFPYRFMMLAGSLIYVLGGILLLRKLLLKFFDERMSFFVILLLVLATNLLFTSYASLGSTHLLSFFLITLLILQTIKFHEKVSLKNGIFLGAIIGLLFLVRPPDVLLSLIPVFWFNDDFPNFKEKRKAFFNKHKFILLATAATAFFFACIQFAYWKITAGKFLINSYANNAGEGFDWFTPYTLDFLFSFRKGWFVYTPLMIFAVIGLYFWFKKEHRQKIIFITFFIFLYVVSCWTTWWYASSFSSRAMIDFYPILCIGLGYFLLSRFFQKGKWIFLPLIAFLIVLNLFQSYQIENGILHGERMTRSYYFSIFGQTAPPSKKQLRLLSIDRDKIYLHDEQIGSDFVLRKTIRYPSKEVVQNSAYCKAYDFEIQTLSAKPYFWVQVVWHFKKGSKPENSLFFANAIHGKNAAYAWVGKEAEKLEFDSIQNTLTHRYFTPHFRSKKDRLRFCFFHQDSLPLELSEVEFKIFEAKKIVE